MLTLEADILAEDMLGRHQIGDERSCSFEVEGTRLRVRVVRSKLSFITMRVVLALFACVPIAFLWMGINDFGSLALAGDIHATLFATVWILVTVSFLLPIIFVLSLPRVIQMEFDAGHGISTPHFLLSFWARGKKGLVLNIDIYPDSKTSSPQGELRGGFLARPLTSDTKRGLMGLRRRRLKKFFPLGFPSLHFDSPTHALREARKLKRFLRKHQLPIPVLIKCYSTPYRTD